jgi:hypothetical protein
MQTSLADLLVDKGVRILSLDPGETTGFAIMNSHEITECGQLDTKTVDKGCTVIEKLFQHYQDEIDIVVVEDYRVYAWESEKHKWAALHTPKFIGVIHALSRIVLQTTPQYQMAVEAKTFVTDAKLKAWDLYVPAKRHAMDAVRHAVHCQLFGKHTKPKSGVAKK